MDKGRLEAFSDGVIAILITIMILELKPPKGSGWSSLDRDLFRQLSTYVLSFVYLGIYWTNHHHMLQATDRINGTILWANLHLLFWLSLVPFVTDWLDAGGFPLPTAVYGLVLLLSGIAYLILQHTIIVEQGAGSKLRAAVGRDVKGKLSAALYAAAIPLAFVHTGIADGIYVCVALMWLIPDRRIESTLKA